MSENRSPRGGGIFWLTLYTSSDYPPCIWETWLLAPPLQFISR